MHPFFTSRRIGKENIMVHKKYIQEKNDAIFGWLVGYLFNIWLFFEEFGWSVGGLWVVWLVCGWLGLFVGGLTDLWVVSSFTAKAMQYQLANISKDTIMTLTIAEKSSS